MGNLLVFLLVIFQPPLNLKIKTWEAGGWIGGANYFGDINTSLTGFKYIRPGGGVVLKRNFSSYFSIRGQLNGGYLTARDAGFDNPFQSTRNLSFKSPLVELSGQVEVNFFRYKTGDEKYYFTPFMFFGPGVFYFNPRTDFENETFILSRYGTEGQNIQSYNRDPYSKINLSFAAGAGIKYSINRFWNLGFEIGYRKTTTDYLDDISLTYVDKAELLVNGGENAVSLSDRSTESRFGVSGKQRGNSTDKDAYVFTGVILTYTFKNNRCPNAY